MAAPSLLSLPPIKLTSRPVIGFDQTRTRHGKRGDVTSKASFQLSEFGLIGLFAVYGILRIAGIDPFARGPPPKDGGWGGREPGPPGGFVGPGRFLTGGEKATAASLEAKAEAQRAAGDFQGAFITARKIGYIGHAASGR